MNLIRTILIIMLVYYGIKFISRLLFPILMKRFANKMQDRFQQQFNQRHQNTQSQPQEEGKVTIEKTNTSAQTKSDKVGEYVDFEEVDE